MEFKSTQDRVWILSDKREDYIKKREASWDEKTGEYNPDSEDAIDKLADAIMEMIRENYLSLPFDFILEELTKLGDAPSLIYDDDGHWAIPSSSFGTAVLEKSDDYSVTFFIDKDQWFDSIRGALEHYLFHE